MNEKSEVSKQIYKQIKELILKKGFIYKNGIFFTIINDFTVTLQLVKSPWNNKGIIQFWMEFAIYAMILPKNSKPSEDTLIQSNTCLLRKRLGYFEDNDVGIYKFDGGQSQEIFINEIKSHLNQFLNFLSEFKSFFDFIDFLEKENKRKGRNVHSFMVAITLAELGHLGLSKKFFQESEGDKIAIKNMAKHYGLEI